MRGGVETPPSPPKTYDLYERSHFEWDTDNTTIIGLSEAGQAIVDAKTYVTMSIPDGTVAVGKANGSYSTQPFKSCGIKVDDAIHADYDWTEVTETVSKVTELKLPSSLRALNTYAFYNFVLVSELELPSGLETIGEYALGEVGFETVTIPNTVTSLSCSFYGCRNLTTINFQSGSTITEIPSQFVAYSDNFENINIPSTVTSIGFGAFDGTGLKNISLPEGLLSIGQYAFTQCDNLETIILPDSLTSIDSYAFSMKITDAVDEHTHQVTQSHNETKFTSIVCATKALYDKIMADSDSTNYKLNDVEKAILTYVGAPQAE